MERKKEKKKEKGQRRVIVTSYRRRIGRRKQSASFERTRLIRNSKLTDGIAINGLSKKKDHSYCTYGMFLYTNRSFHLFISIAAHTLSPTHCLSLCFFSVSLLNTLYVSCSCCCCCIAVVIIFLCYFR